ncbi:GFA family protein [Luteimonas sp. RD2P54]|uniref:GFA family protein n=1 Tax=Luteimonas endophytica TaxID=3042023 RepID=A0ABT6J7P4_9GAMM|nr:GFA family protein [Luteimonas endophytica]MDH5822843.1 GFA family protein [Luteimonas endophytica]
MTRTGGCKCGTVRYTIRLEPVTTRLCWCRDCQYWAAGNAAVNIVVPRAALTVEGVPSAWDSVADSGSHMRRSFCGTCGTQLFSEARENAEHMVVRVGTLDDAGGIRPESVIWTASAPPWALIDPALKAFPGQPT